LEDEHSDCGTSKSDILHRGPLFSQVFHAI